MKRTVLEIRVADRKAGERSGGVIQDHDGKFKFGLSISGLNEQKDLVPLLYSQHCLIKTTADNGTSRCEVVEKPQLQIYHLSLRCGTFVA